MVLSDAVRSGTVRWKKSRDSLLELVLGAIACFGLFAAKVMCLTLLARSFVVSISGGVDGGFYREDDGKV